MPVLVAPWSCSAPAPRPISDTTSEWCHPMVSAEHVEGCELAPPVWPYAADSLCVVPASRPCRILQTVSSTLRPWVHSRPVSFQSLDNSVPRPRRESIVLETHYPQAVLATAPTALIPLSVPN